MSLLDDASIVVVPSGYKAGTVYSVKPTDGSGDLSFTRALDTATRVGPDGLIEKVRTNAVRNSTMVAASAPSTLPTNWSAFGGGLSVDVVDTGTENGLQYIDIQLSGTSSSNNARVSYETFDGILASFNQVWTNSAFVKTIAQPSPPNTYNLFFREALTGGSLTALGGTEINPTSVLSRFSATRTLSAATTQAVQPSIFFTLTIGETYDFTFRIAATQMEQGDIATPYIPTTTAAVSVGMLANVPRLDYLGGGCPKLLLEPQRTNLIRFSEQLNNAAWTKLNVTISANVATSPAGFLDADKEVANSGANLSSISNTAEQTISKAASALAFTYSVFAKESGLNRLTILAQSGSIDNRANVTFSLNNGSIVSAAVSVGAFSAASATATDYGNGWYRLTLSFTTDTAATLRIRNIPTDSTITTGDGVTGILLYGCQAELGSYATSYIPTLGAAVTRSDDEASKTGISALIGQTEGTLFLDFEKTNNDNTGLGGFFRLDVNDGTNSNRILFGFDSNQVNATVVVATVQANMSTTGVQTQKRIKAAFAYKANDFVMFVNGALIATDTSGDVPIGMANFQWGVNQTTPTQTSAVINQQLFFPTRLTNAQLEELTA